MCPNGFVNTAHSGAHTKNALAEIYVAPQYFDSCDGAQQSG